MTDLTDKQLKYREYYDANKDDIRRRKLEAYYVKTYDSQGKPRPPPTKRALEKQVRTRLDDAEKENEMLKQTVMLLKMIHYANVHRREEDDY